MKRLPAIILALTLVFSLTSSVLAQSYSFSLDVETVHVYWNSDGSIALDYYFVFSNDLGAHPIDFVDVGLPNGSYDYGSISADVEGNPVSISTDFQGDGPYGIAVEMGSYTIPAGETGSVHVYIGRVSNVLYEDSTDANFASAVFSPAYFTTAHGSTDLTVVFHLPPEVTAEEPRWHGAPSGFPSQPLTGYDNEGRITYTWRNTSAYGNTQYTFGASFPMEYIPSSEIVRPPAFRIDLESLMGFLCPCTIVSFFIGIPILGALSQRNRKLKYLPPKISIEGHGIKRGLTAVEAALLLEQPLDKIMTMILFGVVKKEAATVTSRDPLNLQVVDPLPEGLREYEKDFLAAFKETSPAARRKALQEMTVKLVKAVSEKMKGFSRKETTDYYKNIMERAWQQITAADTPEVKSQMYEESLEWTMLDDDYDERTRRVFTGPIFVPVWWGRYDPGYRPSTPKVAAGAPSVSTGRGAPSSVPGSAFAASVITGVQNFSSKVLGDVRSFTGGVTNRTNPVPKPSGGSFRSSSGGGRSSGGCACACACAGCACACAGGGR